MPMSKYQISTMKDIEVTVFSKTEGKLQEYQINIIQMYKFKLFKIQVSLPIFFFCLE